MQQYRKFFITYHWTCCTWVPLLEPEIKRCLYHRADQVLQKKLGLVPGSVYVVVGPAFVQPVSLMYIFEQRWTIQVGTTGFGECFSEPGVGRFFLQFILQFSSAMQWSLFFTANWLPHGQLWAIHQGTASLTRF